MDKEEARRYTEDLSFDFKDPNAPAMFVPSISKNYVGYASLAAEKMTEERAPKGTFKDIRELNFLQEDNGSFYYPAALTSAGHANLNYEDERAIDREGIFRKRDKNKTVIIGDSGGYQIGKGVLKFDWKNFESEENNKLRLKILRWLESIADISMTLDVPTWGIGGALEGVDTFQDCLEKTVINHDFFIKNRVPGATRFMNILHGRNQEEADIWYDTVKDLPFEGWALAGVNIADFERILYRLIKMRDEGYLDKDRNWMHFLGVSKLSAACAFTTIQRSLRKYVEPEFTISFDASSPFLSVAKGRMYSRLTYSPKTFSYSSDSVIDSKKLAGSKIPFPLMSPIGKKLLLGDLCVRGEESETKSSWDSWSYMFMMNHNTYMHARGIKEAVHFYDMPRSKAINFVPANLLEFKDLCDEIFRSETPYDLIKNNSRLLMNLTGSRTENMKLDAFEMLGIFEKEDEDPSLKIGWVDGEHDFDDSALDE